jgi:hypothetical protein
LALGYCDLQYKRQQVKKEQERARSAASGLLDNQRGNDLNPFTSPSYKKVEMVVPIFH